MIVIAALFAACDGSATPRLPREIKDADGAPMTLVPKGEFVMGSPLGTYIFGDNEAPRRRIKLEAFYIDKFEVTNARFRKHLTPNEDYPGSFTSDD